ncbi:MAG: GDSL family lipase [Planctomycetes bacterium]|nr:GDSL family lipase [Planctomycetota bacterium]
MGKIISHDDKNIIWGGAVDVETGEGWSSPWRLPKADIECYQTIGWNAEASSSVRLRIATDSTTAKYITEPIPNKHAVDLYADHELVESMPFEEGASEFIFTGLPSGMKVLDLWLPPNNKFKLKAIELDDGASVELAEDKRPRWITYGSSISHCNAAGSGATTWPAIVAREKGFNLTSFGFSGECHLDPMMARYMRDIEADFISVKAGINIQGRGSIGERGFLPAVIGTIATIREKHPETPFVFCSPVFSCRREDHPTDNSPLTLIQIREFVKKGVELMQSRGDKNLYYVDGLDIFSSDLAHLLPDDLHPNAEGYCKMAENFQTQVFEKHGIKIPGMK